MGLESPVKAGPTSTCLGQGMCRWFKQENNVTKSPVWNEYFVRNKKGINIFNSGNTGMRHTCWARFCAWTDSSSALRLCFLAFSLSLMNCTAACPELYEEGASWSCVLVLHGSDRYQSRAEARSLLELYFTPLHASTYKMWFHVNRLQNLSSLVNVLYTLWNTVLTKSDFM